MLLARVAGLLSGEDPCGRDRAQPHAIAQEDDDIARPWSRAYTRAGAFHGNPAGSKPRVARSRVIARGGKGKEKQAERAARAQQQAERTTNVAR